MKYHKNIQLKDGRTCILRNATASDGKTVLDVFNLTHEQTDWLLTYPEEQSFTVEQEAEFLQNRTDSLDESEGFVEYGRNPKGFHSLYSGWQELILMRLELLD